MLRPVCMGLLFALLAGPAAAENWPAWRGPNRNGHSGETEVPTVWSKTENVRWKAKLPMAGNSTPIIWENRIFLTQCLDKGGHKRALICFDRKDGSELWRKVVDYKENEPTHKTNPYCSASPLTDGKRVIISHGSAGMFCYDFDGNEKWKVDLGRLYHIWGNASSPIFYGDLVILWCGPGERQFLLAVNKETGKEVWKTNIPGGNNGKDRSNWLGSWSTPIIITVNERDEMIVPISKQVKAFDPKTGKELWSCDGLGPLVYTSAVASKDGIVVAMAGYGGAALAVKAGGNGDVTKTHRLWLHKQRNPQRIGSGVVVGQHLYMLSTPGQAQCFELQTGNEVWKRKKVGDDQNWSNMVVVGDTIYVVNTGGDCFLFDASPKFALKGTNSIGELVRGSIAISNGELFIRSYNHLWCIAED